jgi:hypothetical protein
MAMLRLPNVLDTNIVANQRTLEQKISDQGPDEQRVDPHLLRLALSELVHYRRLIREITLPESHVPWYANAGQDPVKVTDKLGQLAPLYEQVAHGAFPNLVGDALEIVVFRQIQARTRADRRCSYQGSIDYHGTKTRGRYRKVDPPLTFMEGTSHGPVDFIFNHPDVGALFVECKNVREWIYPNDGKIKELIRKCCATGATPLFIARRIHYATITNLLEPAGIIAHESYHQYYPDGDDDLIARVRHKRSLGFTDVRSWEDPDRRTGAFFRTMLPAVGAEMAARFRRHRRHLLAYAENTMSRAELYRVLRSPAHPSTKGELPDNV